MTYKAVGRSIIIYAAPVWSTNLRDTNYRNIQYTQRLQTTQPTSGVAVTADSSCCANCVEPPRPHHWGPDLPFLCMSAMMTRWMAGAAAHKSG